ncbi:hypothetical protein FB107DRAFT_212709, partial [Schizophyllum commune]
DDDQAPTPSTNSARATGQRGYHGTIHAFLWRLSRLLHPRRQGRSARMLRALVQIQREQADDLRGLARNSDQLASLCVLQGMPIAPLPPRPGSPTWTFERLGNMWPDLARQFWESRLPSREGSLAETIRSSLRATRGSFASNSSGDAIAPPAPAASAAAFGSSVNNVRGSRVSAPAVLGQAHAEASPAAPRNSGDEDEDSSESFYTPRQSFSDDRDDASLSDGSMQDSSSASDDELDHSALLAANNVTHVFVYRINVANEAFSGVRLVIQVGEREALDDPSRAIPFSYALPRVVSCLKESGHALTQLHVILHRPLVQGGTRDKQDALVTIFKEAREHLRCVLSVHVAYATTDRGLAPQTTRLAKAMIHSAFSGLHRLRIEGQTVSSRVTLFPLRRLRHVEIVMDISEEDVMTIMHSCPVLDVLVVTSTQTASNSCPVENYVQTSEDPAHPMVLQLNGDHFGLDLLRVVPAYVDLRLTLSPASPHLEDISRFLDSREYTISPLRI